MAAQPYGFSIRGIKHVLTSWFVRGLAWTVRHLPGRWMPRLATLLARSIVSLLPRRRRIAESNIRVAFGDTISDERVAEIADRCVRNIALGLLELLRLPVTSRDELRRMLPVEGLEHLQAGLERGRGVLLITGHIGTWELAGCRVAAEGHAMHAVARDAAHTATAQVINSARASHGMKVLGRDATREMLRVLRNNGVLAILPDQRVLEGGIVADFMGRPAMTVTGPATLAMRTGCAVVPGFGGYRDDGSRWLELRPPLQLVDTGDREADVATNTQMINDALADFILEHPEQWLWLHDRWRMPGDPR